MNKERILILAELLEMTTRRGAKPKFGFNMGAFESSFLDDRSGHDCGTTGCIAGWAIRAFTNFDSVYSEDRPDDGSPDDFAASLLELDEPVANDLFYAENFHGDCTPRHAAKVLRHLAKTGKVDWNKAV